MNDASLLVFPDIFGFYELDSEGTVLYSRIKREGKFEKADSLLIGRNFFDDVLMSKNVNALRRRFKNFMDRGDTSDNFVFEYDGYDAVVPLKILIVNVAEKSGAERENLIFVEIRQI